MKNGTAKVLCTCAHVEQDKLHGAQTRIANASAKQDKDTAEVVCTVCKKVHRVNLSKVR